MSYGKGGKLFILVYFPESFVGVLSPSAMKVSVLADAGSATQQIRVFLCLALDNRYAFNQISVVNCIIFFAD